MGRPVFTIISLTSAAIIVGVNTPEERTQWINLLNEPVNTDVNINRTRSFYGMKAIEKSELNCNANVYSPILTLTARQKKGGTFKRFTNTLRSRKKYSFDTPEEEGEEKEKGLAMLLLR